MSEKRGKVKAKTHAELEAETKARTTAAVSLLREVWKKHDDAIATKPRRIVAECHSEPDDETVGDFGDRD